MNEIPMRVLFLGDIVGASGRDAVKRYLTPLFQSLKPDAVIVNAENAAHGVGLNPRICEDLFAWGVDVITTGNHIYDKREIIPFLAEEPRVLRPANYPAGSPGHGLYVHQLADGRRLGVINLMGRLFMDALDCPFIMADQLLSGLEADCVFMDFHAEATSEKATMAYYVDGRVNAVVGTHTHVPTGDARILPNGTGFQADAGMCGDYNSVIGMRTEAPLEHFAKKMRTLRLEPAEGEGTVSGIVMDFIGRRTRALHPIRLGPHLLQTKLDDVLAALQ